MRSTILWPILIALAVRPLAAQERAATATRAPVAEAFALFGRVGEQVWPGWGVAPSQLLLVSDSTEQFYTSPSTGVVTWSRPRRFPATLQATFPAVDGIPTIVIGTPDGTGTPRDRWRLVVLHEHFHQLQYSRPDYYQRLNALGLARGDTTGMWALNYAFPYDSAPIRAAFDRWSAALHAALAGPARDRAAGGMRAREVKRALDRLLSADDRRYLDFQLWQEGVPRWIELAIAREGFKAGVVDSAALRWQEDRLVNALTRVDLARDRRTVVYPVGAAVAELLEWEGMGWRERYFERMFVLE